MKRHIRHRCLLFELKEGLCPVFLDLCGRWSLRSNQLISATFILIAPKEVEWTNLRIFHHRYPPISIHRNCILWPESTVQTHKISNSQFFAACALDANYIVAFFSNAMLKYFFNILNDLLLSRGRYSSWHSRRRIFGFKIFLRSQHCINILRVTALHSNWLSCKVDTCERKSLINFLCPPFWAGLDKLSFQLGSARVGCTVKNVVVNRLMFVDDIYVFSHSVTGLQCLLKVLVTIMLNTKAFLIATKNWRFFAPKV